MTSLRVVKISVAEKKYSPDQPRVPAGDTRGGQWAPEDGAVTPAASPSDEVSIQYKNKAASKAVMTQFGITENQVRRMFSLPGYRSIITIVADKDLKNPESSRPPSFSVSVSWVFEDKQIGSAHRSFYTGECINEALTFETEFQGRGLAEELYERQIEILAKESKVDKIILSANISIGRYAWAKQGFQYLVKDGGEQASEKFKTWAAMKGIKKPPGNWPQFRTPQDVANYRIPGVKIPADAISNYAVKPGDYEVGKAFMLDRDGHGQWSAVLWLKNKN